MISDSLGDRFYNDLPSAGGRVEALEVFDSGEIGCGHSLTEPQLSYGIFVSREGLPGSSRNAFRPSAT